MNTAIDLEQYRINDQHKLALLEKVRAKIEEHKGEDLFADIGHAWQSILGIPVSAQDVALCMAALKMVRIKNGYSVTDSYLDAISYLVLAECHTEDDQ